jgi:hypothetical protein
MKHTTIHILHARHANASETLCGIPDVPAHRVFAPEHNQEAIRLARNPRYPHIQICRHCATGRQEHVHA